LRQSVAYYPDLVYRIVSMYGSQEKFAEAVGITKQQLSRKLTCVSGISRDDIIKWCSLLSISKNEIPKYFF